MNVNLRINYKQNYFEERGILNQQLEVARMDNGLTVIKKFSGHAAGDLYSYLTGILSETESEKLEKTISNFSEEKKKEILELQVKTMCECGENEEFDDISHAEHYNSGYRFEPRKVISDWDLNFNLGNTVKYISRAGRKGDKLTDLKKAMQYLQWEIERLEND